MLLLSLLLLSLLRNVGAQVRCGLVLRGGRRNKADEHSRRWRGVASTVVSSGFVCFSFLVLLLGLSRAKTSARNPPRGTDLGQQAVLPPGPAPGGRAKDISTWFGVWVSTSLRFSGPEAHAGPSLLLRTSRCFGFHRLDDASVSIRTPPFGD